MNYLAHVFFAQATPASMLGNLLPDFSKTCPHPQFAAGMANHRLVDQVTDQDPAVLQLKTQIQPKYRRFAGIIIDVSFDYFLSKHWQRYHHMPRAEFIQHSYALLAQQQALMPTRMQTALSNIIRTDVLGSYADLQGIDTAFQRISTRIKRDNPLSSAIEELERQYTLFDQAFLQFFPILCMQVQQARIE